MLQRRLSLLWILIAAGCSGEADTGPGGTTSSAGQGGATASVAQGGATDSVEQGGAVSSMEQDATTDLTRQAGTASAGQSDTPDSGQGGSEDSSAPDGGGSACTGPDPQGLPCCLQELFAPCMPSGACTADGFGTVCYENGVTFVTELNGRTTYSKGDTVCFTYIELFDGSRDVAYYFDAQGLSVGSIRRESPTTSTVACAGEPATTLTHPPPTGTCASGTCNTPSL